MNQDILRGVFAWNMSDEEIIRCVATMKAKATGDNPHPFFA
jgi:N-hydroxyarylamine O-acetyltransferase